MAHLKIVFVGRLEDNTGIPEFTKWLDKQIFKWHVDFIGDGILRKKCENYGKVHGFIDAKNFYNKASICVPGGYLSYIEAKSKSCKIMTFASNPLKRDYWNEIKRVKDFPSWNQIANEYLDLYNNKKRRGINK